MLEGSVQSVEYHLVVYVCNVFINKSIRFFLYSLVEVYIYCIKSKRGHVIIGGCVETGILTMAIRRCPFTVVLLCEIDKEHRDIFNIVLQLIFTSQISGLLLLQLIFDKMSLIIDMNLWVGVMIRFTFFSNLLLSCDCFVHEFLNQFWLGRMVSFNNALIIKLIFTLFQIF